MTLKERENMAKEETTEKVTLTVSDGIRFGLGFLLVNMVAFAAIGVVAWLVLILARYFGLAL
jgi:hypothetical protein